MFVIAGGILLAWLVLRVGLPLLKWLILLLAFCWVLGAIVGP